MSTEAKITFNLPVGPDHYWQRMRHHTKARGLFTVSNIHDDSNGVTRHAIRGFIAACVKGGVVEHVGETRVNNRAEKTYCVVAGASVRTPVVPRYGANYARQQQMWTAMRTLKQFDLVELAAAATTDDCAISYALAAAYVARFNTAGLVTCTKGARGKLTYRLKPGTNTGPIPPRFLKATIVFDGNKKRVVGETHANEVSA